MSYRILALDGGGIRGVITAVWLRHLERKLNRPLHECFDLIAGTSTGSILACGISLGVPAERIVQMYVQRGQEVFPSFSNRIWDRLQRTLQDGLDAPRYDGLGLNRVLRDVFGDTRFGELKLRPTLVVSYNTSEREAVVFKNTRPEFTDLPVWEIVRSSCSAPAYFPPHLFEFPQAPAPLIDGGVVANNPTACAIAEGIRHLRQFQKFGQPVNLQDFVVASFGTGQTSRRISFEEARSWGALQWAIPVLDVIFDGVGDAVDYISQQILQDERYFRFQCRLDPAHEALDNADPANVQKLIKIAEEYLHAAEGALQIELLVEQLKEQPILVAPPVSVPAANLPARPSMPVSPPRSQSVPVPVSPSPTRPASPIAPAPVLAQPVAAQSVPTQSVPTQSVPTQPVPTQPVATQPVRTQPIAIQPVAAPPVVAQPAPTQTTVVAKSQELADAEALQAALKRVFRRRKSPAVARSSTRESAGPPNSPPRRAA